MFLRTYEYVSMNYTFNPKPSNFIFCLFGMIGGMPVVYVISSVLKKLIIIILLFEAGDKYWWDHYFVCIELITNTRNIGTFIGNEWSIHNMGKAMTY